MRYPTTCARPTSKLPHPHSLSYFSFHSLPSPSQCQCDLWWSSRGIYSSLSGLVYNCSLHLWGLPPVLLPVDAGRVLPHKLEKLCVATNLLLSHSSVCVCMCVCMSVTMYGCQFACFFQVVMPPFSWHEPPEETYSDVNIFGLQTVYVVVSICTSWRIPLQAMNICTLHTFTQLFVVASIVSLVFWGYFYCFCLLHVVVNNDILQRVLRSITKNGNAHLLQVR